MFAILLFAAALLADAAPAAPAATPPPPPPAKPKTQIEAPVAAVGLVPVVKDEKVVCRKETLVGTRLPKTVCMSKEDAAERRKMDQDAVRHAQDLSKLSNVQ